MPGSLRSGSTSWDDCGGMFPDELSAIVYFFIKKLVSYTKEEEERAST